MVKDYELENLAVMKPALAPKPPSLTLRLQGGEPQLVLTPKRLEPGDAVPDFTMTTEDGQAASLSDLRGKVVVLTFIYTRCPLPDFCPLMDRKFAALADGAGYLPRACAARPADLAQLRPRARHARSAEEARADPGGPASALDLRRRLATTSSPRSPPRSA